eukprot:COSAG06_NODE_15809_length_1043_cov_0.978814_2_plen_89_part_00
MLFGRDYATPVSLCLRLALLVLPVLHAAMWSTRFVRDISKLSNPKYRLAIIARGTLAVVSICPATTLQDIGLIVCFPHVCPEPVWVKC